MTRILFFGDMASTGFGTVTMDLGRELLNLGHDLRFVSQNEVGDLPEPFDSRTFRVDESMTVAELADDFQGTQGLGHTSLSLASAGIAGLIDGRLWADHWTPEACIVLGDFGNVRLVVLRDEQTRDAFASVPTFHYVPIEGVDLPPTLRLMWQVVRPVAMSHFGAKQIEGITGTLPPMVYHGVDTDTFHPVSPESPIRIGDSVLRDKAACKKLFGGRPDSRWIFRADRNMPRKRYASLLRSMAPVLAQRPDTFLVMHCLTMDLGGDLSDLLAKYPPAIRSRMLLTGFHDQGMSVSRAMLAALYNAADVYVSVSAEGFGLTIAESLACGTPAVGIDYSSVPEVIGPGGVCTPIAGIVDNEFGYYWAAANERVFGQAVGDLLDDPLARKQMGREGAKHVRASFSWAKAAIEFSALVRDAVGQEAAA